MRIEVNRNFSTVDIYKGEQLVSAIDLEGSVIEVAKELTDLFAVLDIDCEVVEIEWTIHWYCELKNILRRIVWKNNNYKKLENKSKLQKGK